MDELIGPIIGITLVLMAVFLPAAFLPGLTGQMYAQFALVIAATALISAINAATLKPTQCALWLRRPVPPEQRNFFYRGFNSLYERLENGYARLIRAMVRHSGAMVLVALAIIGAAVYGMSRVATGFLPIEDQGYVLAAVQLPDGAALGRTQKRSSRSNGSPTRRPASSTSSPSPASRRSTTMLRSPMPASPTSCSRTGACAARGGSRVALQDAQRQPCTVEDGASWCCRRRRSRASAMPAASQCRSSCATAASISPSWRARSTRWCGRPDAVGDQRVSTPFRASAPQYKVEIDREKVQTLLLTTDQVFSTLASYLGSSYVDQFNKFGRMFQIYVQGDAHFRMSPDDILDLKVRNQNGDMIPLGTVLTITPSVGPSLISLYNLYPSATIVGVPAKGFSSGDAIKLMEEIAARTLPPGVGFSWTALSYQEKLVGKQIYFVFALALLLVYLVLAGQYESWYAPITVLLAVPMSLIGPVIVMLALHIENNLYVQIGLVLLIALSAKNAILIVEVARELRAAGKPIAESAYEAARARFRPILMTSFAFILGVLPLVLATGAGASARKSIGITVFSGMIASTCLAVLFVPSLFVIVQRFEEWRASRKVPAKAPAKAPSQEATVAEASR